MQCNVSLRMFAFSEKAIQTQTSPEALKVLMKEKT
jgi:hypothetical protein